jgi:peptidoglycan/xylan/chitin deacetylase (PgdA/CDA1 family)
MKSIRHSIIRVGLEALYFSGATRLLRSIFGGAGTIFMLHHVHPPRGDAFQPNRHLEITPEFLRLTLQHIRELDVDIVTLDEMHRRLTTGDLSRRFACFTFDDGYRDNRDHALPVMRAFGAPFTVYVAGDFACGHGRLWWVALERLVRNSDVIDAPIDGIDTRLDAATAEAKAVAFATLHDWLRDMPTDHEVASAMSDLCRRHQVVDETAIAPELCMSWDELKSFAADPLVTIGAHTMSHCNIAHATDENAEREMAMSRAIIQSKLGLPADHLAYPYGDRNAATARDFAIAAKVGFKTAVTTRPGMVFAENAAHLMALPRLSLNGNYQDERLLTVLTTGAATAVWNGFRRVDAA